MWKNIAYMCNSSWGDPVHVMEHWKSDWLNLSLFRPQQSTEVETWSCRSWRSWEGSVTARDPGITTPLVSNTLCLQHTLSATHLVCSTTHLHHLVCNTPCLQHTLSATPLVCNTYLSATPLVNNTLSATLLVCNTLYLQHLVCNTSCPQHPLSATPLACNISLSATPLNNTLSATPLVCTLLCQQHLLPTTPCHQPWTWKICLQPELTFVLPFKAWIGQNIATYASPTARNFFLVQIATFPVCWPSLFFQT